MPPPIPPAEFPPDAWQAIRDALGRFHIPHLGARILRADHRTSVAVIGLLVQGDHGPDVRPALYVYWTGGLLTVIDAEAAEEYGAFLPGPAMADALCLELANLLAKLDAEGRFATREPDLPPTSHSFH